MLKPLKSKKKIETIFEKGFVIKEEGLILKAYDFKDGESSFGVSVPKKIFASAVNRNKIKRLLPDTLAGQVDFLPSLRDGEAFVSGDSINLPRKVQFRVPNPMPRSNDVRYHMSWKLGKPENYSLKALVNSWQKQDKSK